MYFEYQYTSIPVHQYTSIPVAAVTHATHGIDDSALDFDAPSSRRDRASRRNVGHFCPSRPGVTPGPQDHSYTRVWCNTRPLGPLSARVWCNTRPPGPLQPPSGELVIPAAPSWEFPGIVPQNSWNTAGTLSWHNTRTRGPPPIVLLGLLPPPVALLGETRPLGSLLPRDFSSGPDSSHLIAQVCVHVSRF